MAESEKEYPMWWVPRSKIIVYICRAQHYKRGYEVPHILLRLSTTTTLITVGELLYVRFDACVVISKRCYNLYNSTCLPYVFPEMFATLIFVAQFVRAWHINAQTAGSSSRYNRICFFIKHKYDVINIVQLLFSYIMWFVGDAIVVDASRRFMKATES